MLILKPFNYLYKFFKKASVFQQKKLNLLDLQKGN